MNPGQPNHDPPADGRLPQATPVDDNLSTTDGELAEELEPDLEPVEPVLQATPVDGIPVVPGGGPPDDGEMIPAAVVEGVARQHPGANTISDAVFQSDEFLAKRYDMIRRVGRGGMSVVYLAHDRQLHRNVAVKVTRPFGAEELDVQTARFVNEARILARLNHPNIVQVYDFAASESGMRIIMEYVEGRTLYQRVSQDGAMSEVEVAAITCEVLDAIELIHGEGVIHRDMKPGNVMLDDKGRDKVMDFGIAQTDGLDTDASSGSVVGTIKFMAPEQSRAEAVTERSDLFSIGATMAYMLLGELPSVLRADQLPLNLRPVLLRAMARDPEARYTSAGEMREAIEVAARQPQPTAIGSKKLLLLFLLLLVGGGIGLALAGTLLLWGWLGRADPPPRVTPETGYGSSIGEQDVVSGGGMLVIEDEPGDGQPAVEPPEDDSARDDAEREREERRKEREEREEREERTERETTTGGSATTAPVAGSTGSDKPKIKHPIVTSAADGDPVRFEVYVFGDETYSVSISYRGMSATSWRNLNLRHRGDGRYTATLRIGGELAEGVAYSVTVLEESGAGRAFTRGSLSEPYVIQVD